MVLNEPLITRYQRPSILSVIPLSNLLLFDDLKRHDDIPAKIFFPFLTYRHLRFVVTF